MRFSLTLMLFLACVAGIARAQDDRPVLIELFTSQGCSSCPPADAFLAELIAEQNVIGLSLHVDYWDYLGWRDPFASPEMTARQKAYAYTNGSRSVYTPQMVIDGSVVAVGHDRAAVIAAISAARARPVLVEISVSLQDDMLVIHMQPLRANIEGVLHVVHYATTRETEVGRGENSGRVLRHSNVVTDWSVVGLWDGTETTLHAPWSGSAEAAAVILQDGPTGPVIAAASFKP